MVQSCPTLYNSMDSSLSHSSVHVMSQARVLGWVAISFSRGSSRPRDRTRVSRLVGRRFTVWATREVLLKYSWFKKKCHSIYLCSFWLCWVFLAAYRLSLVAASGVSSGFGVQGSPCGGFSCCRAALGHAGFSSCGARAHPLSRWALEHRLSSCGRRA